jgi:hypothetical protein
VGGKDARDDAIEEIPVGGEVTAVKVKRRRAPEVAPLGSEDLGAGAFLGGEERDDLAEDSVGEGADAVGASSVILAHSPPPPSSSLN